MKKKILITGAAGFIGSHLTEYLLAKNFNIVVFDKYNNQNSVGWLDNTKALENCEIKLGDIRDYDSVLKAMKNCSAVIHLAALIGIPYSYVSPIAYLKTNIEGTYNVLEAAKNLNLENIIITSTSEVYGTTKILPINEKANINCQSPYAATKAAADQLALSYEKSFKLPVKIIRPFNTYGPRQSHRAVIPSIISQCLNQNEKKVTLGNLKPKRDLNFVQDLCAAFYEVLKCKNLVGEIVNVGTNESISVENLTMKIMKIINIKKKINISKHIIRPAKSEVDDLVCDNRKIKKLTLWKSKTSLDFGLLKTIEWFKENEKFAKKSYHL